MATVTETECEQRRKDLYDKIDELEKANTTLVKEYAQMKGGIAVAKWLVALVLPLMILLLGAFMKLQIDSLKQDIRYAQKSPAQTGP